eukprot:1191565-Pyramimonas_sp.AAC.1
MSSAPTLAPCRAGGPRKPPRKVARPVVGCYLCAVRVSAGVRTRPPAFRHRRELVGDGFGEGGAAANVELLTPS